MVYDLDAPITLSPGDSLELEELTLPTAINGDEDDIKTLALSFNGFASIEG